MADDGLPAIDLPRLPASDWLQIFSSQRPWAPVLDGDRSLWVKGPIRDASVLIALTVRGGVLLTERSPSMRQHPSQVAFPGGRIEAQDRNATEAACREAQEEIGLDPRRLRPVGALPPYLTGSAYRVHAVVALLDDALDLHRQLEPDPNEVASVFEVPLAFLLN
ncbi:MAG: CoA pyrophosphatase, partial [Betaproteobacteria bacterium]|nr:CoA pyrophosphatase [Betaproteobacteria bacterium]